MKTVRLVTCLGVVMLLWASLGFAESLVPPTTENSSTGPLTPAPSTVSPAGDPIPYSDVTFTWRDADLLSHIQAVLVRDHIAYCNLVDGIQIIDVADPTHPIELSQLILPNASPNMVLKGDYLYVEVYPSAGIYKLAIVNISDPSAPVLVKTLSDNPFSSFRSLFIRSNYLYILTNYALFTYDLTLPDNPQFVSKTVPWVGDQYIAAYTVDDRYLYAIMDNPHTLQVLDLIDPNAPIVIGETTIIDHCNDVAVLGDRACLATTLGSIEVYDITDRANLHYLGSATAGGYFTGVKMNATAAYAWSDRYGLYKFDLTNPSAPALTAQWQPTIDWQPSAYYLPWGTGVRQIVLEDNLVLACRDQSGIEFLDFSTGEAPALVGTYVANDYSLDVGLNGTNLYVATYHGGLRVLSTTNHVNPELIGTYPCPTAVTLANAGSIVYLGRSDRQCDILDASDPANPVLVGSFGTPTGINALETRGQRLYLLDSTALHIYDITAPTSPNQLGEVAVTNATTLSVGDTTAVVCVRTSGCVYLNVKDPSAPVQFGGWGGSWLEPCSCEYSNAVTDDQYVYIFADRLYIFDLNNCFGKAAGKSPWQTNQIYHAEIHGKQLWAIDGYGFFVHDISDPTNPEWVGRSQVRHFLSTFTIQDTVLYLAHDASLQTYTFHKCCSRTTGDLNDNGVVDLSDLSSLISYVLQGWYSVPGRCHSALNINGRGIVDLADLSTLIAYLTGPPASLGTCP